MAKEIRLIMTDLDGTLLDPRSNLSFTNIKALKRARKSGIKFMPVSGRGLTGVNYGLRSFPHADYIACCNGTTIYQGRRQKCIYRAEVDHEKAMQVLDYCDTIPCITYGAISNTYYVDRGQHEKYYHSFDIPYSYRTLPGVFTFTDMKKEVMKPKSHVDMIYIVFESPAVKQEADRVIGAMGGLNTPGTYANESEICNIDASKDKVIAHMAEVAGIDPESIIAFGDGDNDAGMLKAAGIGVAMGNALQSAKDAADVVTLSNSEDGVAYMINKYLDGEM